MARLRLGNSFSGVLPARGGIRNFRVGNSQMGEYTSKMANLSPHIYDPDIQGEVVTDEVESFMERTRDAHMATNAYMFCPLTGDDPSAWYSRPNRNYMINDMSGITADDYGSETDNETTLGLRFRITREPLTESRRTRRNMSGYKTNSAYFDNSRMQVSGILWEFSNDGGNRWYPMYDIANTDFVRMNLPNPSTRIRARAWSCDPTQWVQAMAIFPKTDEQGLVEPELTWDIDGIRMDEFGMLFWDGACNGVGDVVYEVYRVDSEQVWRYDPSTGEVVMSIVTHDTILGYTRENRFQLPEYDFMTQYKVVAVDEAGNSIPKGNELYNIAASNGIRLAFDYDGVHGDGDGESGADHDMSATISGTVPAYWDISSHSMATS